MNRGLFITFEGGEGGGKTTLSRRLAAWLEAEAYPVFLTREPGGTPETTPGAADIRQLLVTGEPDRWKPISETLLYAAARHDNVQRAILPALQSGKIVLCDRFNESTIAYQGYGHGQDIAQIRKILDIATGGLQPDLTFILDLPAETALARSKGATLGEDRFEKISIDFHERLRQGFLDMAKTSPRFVVVDATQAIDKVFENILAALRPKLSQAA